MSVLRFAVLVAAALVLVPTDDEQRQKLWRQSQDVASWAMSTCERNPQTCEQAHHAFTKLKENSSKSVALFNDMMHEQLAAAPGSMTSFSSTVLNRSILPTTAGSLSRSDLLPDWRGHLPSGN